MPNNARLKRLLADTELDKSILRVSVAGMAIDGVAIGQSDNGDAMLKRGVPRYIRSDNGRNLSLQPYGNGLSGSACRRSSSYREAHWGETVKQSIEDRL